MKQILMLTVSGALLAGCVNPVTLGAASSIADLGSKAFGLDEWYLKNRPSMPWDEPKPAPAPAQN